MAVRYTPETPSSDYEAMLATWTKVDKILDGQDAMRAAGQDYLPKFPNETEADYEYRRANAKFTNIYRDIAENLSSKPFAEEVGLEDDASDQFEALAEDIDGRGNNLHVFASELFFGGVNYAVDWIFVDYTKARQRADGRPLSLADEKAQGLRPYWVRVPAKRMLAVYSDTVNGKETIVHARMRETVTRRAGWTEVSVDRIRVLDRAPIPDPADPSQVVGYAPATFEVWEKQTSGSSRQSSAWRMVDSGPVTIGEIALVPFIVGQRKGAGWQFNLPLQGVADLQVEHYQAETALKHIKELTAFPMLAGNGVQPQMQDNAPAPVPVGPQSVLYAPPIMGTNSATHGEWKFIEPTAESLKFLASEVEVIEGQMRELGRQPLTATAGITVVTAALASQKASSAVQAWAMALKDALEQAFVFTAKWLNVADTEAPSVRVFTDFALEANDEKGPTSLMEARRNGDLSRRTLWAEYQRRGILSGDFDADAEEQALEEEAPDPDAALDLTGALTPPDPEALAA